MCCNMTRGRRWSFHVVSSWRGSAEFQGSSSRSGSELEGLPGRSRYWRAGDNPLRWENSQSLRIGNLKNVRLLSKCSRVVLNTFWILSSLSSPYSSSPVIKDSRPSIYFYLFFFLLLSIKSSTPSLVIRVTGFISILVLLSSLLFVIMINGWDLSQHDNIILGKQERQISGTEGFWERRSTGSKLSRRWTGTKLEEVGYFWRV